MAAIVAEHPRTAAEHIDSRDAASGAYRLARAILFIVAVGSFDVFNFFDRGGSTRYAILLIPLATLLALRLRRPTTMIRRPAPTDVVLVMLWVVGVTGTIYGLVSGDSAGTARPIFFPMVLGLLSPFVLDTPNRLEARRILQILAGIGGVYVILAVLTNTGVIPGLVAFKQFRNASYALVMMGVVGAYLQRRQGRFLFLVLLGTVNFLAYPSATSVIVAVTTIVVLFVTRPKASSLRPYLVGIVATVAILVAVLNVDRGISVLNSYFDTVNKVNASYGRLSVWSVGLERFQESPVIGDAFSGGTVVTARRLRGGSTFQIPFHNDYILFLADGGAIGFGLLITFIIGVNVTLIRRFRRAVEDDRWADADLLRLMLVTLDSFFVAAAFNPVIEGLSRSTTIFGLYTLAMMIGTPSIARRRTPEGSHAAEPAEH